MGNLSYEVRNTNRTTKTILFGPAKTRKTTWLIRAALTKRHVYIFDGEEGSVEIALLQLPEEYHKYIHIINCKDEPLGVNFQEFVANFISGKPFYWNDTRRCVEANLGVGFSEDCAYWLIDPRKVTPDIIIGLDSWTRLIMSICMHFALKHKITLSKPEDLESDKWTYFRHAGTIADYSLNQLLSLNCHFVLIGHSTVYERRKENSEGKQVVESTRTQLVSVTGPHAGKLPALFDNVLLFNINMLDNVMIDTRAKYNADSGSRSIAPKNYDFNELQFSHIATASKLQPPLSDDESPAFRFFEPGTINEALGVKKKATATVNTKPITSPIIGNSVTATPDKPKAPITLTSLGVKTNG